MTTSTATAPCPPWCTNGEKCDHGEHWSDDLMVYTPATVMAKDGLTEIGQPSQIGAGPVGLEDYEDTVVIHVDVVLGDRCADVVDGART